MDKVGRSWVDKPVDTQFASSASKMIYSSRKAWASLCPRGLLIGWPDVLVSLESPFHTCCLNEIINSTLFTFKNVLIWKIDYMIKLYIGAVALNLAKYWRKRALQGG